MQEAKLKALALGLAHTGDWKVNVTALVRVINLHCNCPKVLTAAFHSLCGFIEIVPESAQDFVAQGGLGYIHAAMLEYRSDTLLQVSGCHALSALIHCCAAGAASQKSLDLVFAAMDAHPTSARVQGDAFLTLHKYLLNDTAARLLSKSDLNATWRRVQAAMSAHKSVPAVSQRATPVLACVTEACKRFRDPIPVRRIVLGVPLPCTFCGVVLCMLGSENSCCCCSNTNGSPATSFFSEGRGTPSCTWHFSLFRFHYHVLCLLCVGLYA